MSVSDILAIAGFGGGGGLFAFLTIIQISKIQFNPWSALGKAIGKALVPGVLEELKKENYFTSNESLAEMEKNIKSDVNECIEVVESHIDSLRTDMEQKDLFGKADYYHDQILLSADKLKAGKIPSYERGKNLYEKIKWYENLCKEHPEYDNGVCPDACAFIKKWWIETYGYTKHI